MVVQIKICGVKDKASIEVCAQAGASYVGFVFVEKSPRFISVEQVALLAPSVVPSVQKVGLFCNSTYDDLAHVLSRVDLDMVQLHGDESVEFCDRVRNELDVKVMKAFGVSSVADVESARSYESVCDWLLFDAKPVVGSNRTGGHGLSFDWTLLQGLSFSKSWMLAGGLTSENVVEALSLLSPDAVDVSSGVESVKGVKDAAKIRAFCNAVTSV